MTDNIIRLPYTALQLQQLLARVDALEGQWTWSHHMLLSDGSIPQGVAAEFSLTSVVPQDGKIYDVLILLSGYGSANLILRGDASLFPFGGSYSADSYRNSFVVKVRQKLIFDSSIQNNPHVWLEVLGYRLSEGQAN